MSASISGTFKRHIVVAIDLSDQSYKALECAAHDVYRPGDCFHLVHINRCLQPQMTIQHNFPGATYDIPNMNPFDETVHTEQVKEVIRARFTSVLDELHIPHVLHMFLDTDNAPASAICDVIFRLAREASATLIVIAAHNKAYGWNELLLGSVADYCLQNSTVPLMLVRDYKTELLKSKGSAPLVIPWVSAHHSPATSPTARDQLKALGVPE